MEEIIDSSVEQFTELLSKHRLSDAQSQLVRDIRRRGKNKLAAQNCRKRKLEVIQTVEDEVSPWVIAPRVTSDAHNSVASSSRGVHLSQDNECGILQKL